MKQDNKNIRNRRYFRKSPLITLILLGCFLNIQLIVGQEIRDTVQLDFWDSFVVSLKIKDTIPDTPDLFKGTSKGSFLVVEIDSVIKIMNSDVYRDVGEILNIQYLLVPEDLKLDKSKKHIVITGSQFSKKYLEFSKIVYCVNPILLDVDVNKTYGVGYGKGLGKIPKPSLFWRILRSFKIVSEDKYYEEYMKTKKQYKDPNLKYIERYEKEQRRKQRKEERSRKTK